jgi:hypothetical protein
MSQNPIGLHGLLTGIALPFYIQGQHKHECYLRQQEQRYSFVRIQRTINTYFYMLFFQNTVHSEAWHFISYVISSFNFVCHAEAQAVVS